ncbi:MAG: hypothetical protein IJ189_04205 [Clostridia bacterium]|nr:hypothetical protein [Clostridia bacterium]
MRCIATFDIGTTAVKAVLVGYDGQLLASLSRDIPTLFDGDRKEQEPRVWWQAFCDLSREMREQCPTDTVTGIVMSGQMQDVIPVDERLQPVCPAILYSDGRGEAEAQVLRDALGEEKIQDITGNHCDGSLSLPKIMWLKKHRPDWYEKTKCFLISSKDYVIAQLTGVCAGDYTACSTACAMDIRSKAWNRELLAAAGVAEEKMPQLFASHEQVGTVSQQTSMASGYLPGTPVYAGVGDAGATTLASGIMREGQYNINLGTSGWVATVSENALSSEGGIFNLAAMPKGKVINVVPFLNAGNVHRWVCRLFSETEEPDYGRVQTLLERSVPGSDGVFALPYLVGERFPVLDAAVRGSFMGITPETRKEDLARAMLEGVAYSIRQGIETIGEKPTDISVIGGGGRVGPWCQMLSDVLGMRLTAYSNADTLPARAIAAAALIGEGVAPDYREFVEGLQTDRQAKNYLPDPETHAFYDRQYRRYTGLYGALKTWYRQ